MVGVALASVSPASAQFIVNHEPYPLGGPGADTALPATQLPFAWNQAADNFQVPVEASVTHVNWWGFHFENVAPEFETTRIRLYRERAGDGLPGDILYEEVFENPERIDTGRTIVIGGGPHEYRYHVGLGVPMVLSPGIGYWLEIVQVGDPASGFRWEYSLAGGDGHAYVNNLVPDWQLPATYNGDLAFQLVIPEPVTASMLLLGLVLAAGVRARGRGRSGWPNGRR